MSFKKELQFVTWIFIFVLSLPLIAILVITNAGIPAVSDTLVSVKAGSHSIQLHDPSGKVVGQIDADTLWPISGVVTLEFGANDLPYQPIHTGIDIAGKLGTFVTPFMSGKVSFIGHLNWGYGNYVMIDNGNNITSLYGHLSETDVSVGQTVQPGDVIGKEGQSGWATGPHVHFEIRAYDVPVNPRTFVSGNP